MMDAAMYLKEKARMRKVQEDGDCGINCDICPLGRKNNGEDVSCVDFESKYCEQAVEIVEKWSKEHPQRTYLSDLLEKYPKAPLIDGDYPIDMCPHYLGYMEEVECCGDCKKCWNTPMED